MIYLSKNDYEEPRCLLNMHPEVTPVPVGRIIEKLDSYLDRNDYDAAERHLLKAEELLNTESLPRDGYYAVFKLAKIKAFC